MKKAQPVLDVFTLEVRYSDGHRYLDVCGQTLLDIERLDLGWFYDSAVPAKTSVSNHARSGSLTFNADTFNVTFTRNVKVEDTLRDIQELWRVVRANLGIASFYRLGVRAQWLLAKKDMEDARRSVRKSPVKIEIPSRFSDSGYAREFDEMTFNISRGSVSYRVGFNPVTKTENIRPPAALTADPRNLPPAQRKRLPEMLRAIEHYNHRPMFGLHLDVDAVVHDPETVDPKAFIEEQIAVLRADFLPLLDQA